jgi:hypothetical protein
MAPGVLLYRKSNVSITSKQQACSLPQKKRGAACCCGCMLQEREMQENLNDNCLALCDNAWVFYSLAAPGIFVGSDVCAIPHDKHQKFFRSCLTDTSFSHIPGLFFCVNTVDFLLDHIFKSLIA